MAEAYADVKITIEDWPLIKRLYEASVALQEAHEAKDNVVWQNAWDEWDAVVDAIREERES